MGILEDGSGDIRKRFDDLCLDLNMDSGAQEGAWESFVRISTNYTLEGDSLHWLACALYVACRNTVVPTVGSGHVEGNFVSLTRLLRSTKLSLLEFFKKIRKWANMANLPQELREKPEEKPKPPRSRKHKRLPCSVKELFNFTWTMFVNVKGNFPAISDDLVNSYHLLLCCIDWVYMNALLSNRKDLLNSDFSGLPESFDLRDYKPPSEVPCLIKDLCEKHDGVLIEAKGIKEHWWKPHVRKLFEKKVIKGRQENLSGVLEIGNFEANSKAINARYEEHVLNCGDFDERVFLDPNADAEIGTPAKHGAYNPGDLQEQMRSTQMRQSLVESSRLAPSTPLTGRKYLTEKTETFTPVTTATQSVHRLQGLLSGQKIGPNDALKEMFSQCSNNPEEEIKKRLETMGEVFCAEYSTCNDDVPPAMDFAKKRLQLAESLYYKVLENVMRNERKRLQAKEPKNCDLSSVMNQDIFHKALIACCMEIVLYSYNSQRVFPWVIDIFKVQGFYFYKVIELVIRAEEGLSRDVVKHLSYIEESVLESQAWKTDSPLWDVIESWQKELNGQIPSVEDVHFPSQIERDGNTSNPTSAFNSPIQHPALRRITHGEHTSLLKKDLLQSPSGPTAVDFVSPTPGSSRRRLFDTPSATSSASSTPPSTPKSVSQTNSPVKVRTITTFQLAQTGDGKKLLIPIPHQLMAPVQDSGTKKEVILYDKRDEKQSENISPNADKNKQAASAGNQETSKPKRTGSFALFLRKVTRKERSFQDIMKCYRQQPQAQSHVYRSILMSRRQRQASGDSDSSTGSQKSKGSKCIRSESTLPVMLPNSDPPTPTRMAGTHSEFEFEDRGEQRGDLIHFYNTIFVDKLKKFSLKFATTDEAADVPILSPLPLARCQQQSPRRISTKHSVFVSQHGNKESSMTPTTKMLYCFNKSPATDLRAINNMLRMNEKGQQASKRLLEMREAAEASGAKKMCLNSSPMFQKRLEMVVNERKANNGIDT
ncbi:hypothetical protein LSH36_35g04056 [Paralvinella palmiformis]|uniref:Retinoblastoma-like protein 1 n=1 Tax=Paralvinella palmiformis TaxID=53620 RepID=A0AAD9K9X9_9ANNE|nr:hypothetical protein LSH36_35g04056 [Paralvinella palmiformis]